MSFFRFDHRRYRLPLRTAVRTAHGIWNEREGVFVRLEDESGKAGYGEASPISWFGTEKIDDVEAACRELGHRVDAERLDRVPARLGCLRHALATARLDLEGGAASPLAAESESSATKQAETSTVAARTVTDYWPVAALLPAGRAAVAQIAPKAEAGFRVFKWKVGVGEIADELALLDDVCAELPAGAKLRLDANGAWDRRQAERWLERCAERPVEFVEQPCFARASEGASRQARTEDLLRGLAADFPTPIALDESLVGEGDVERWLATGWAGIFVLKLALLGNPRKAMARLAAANASVVFSSALETALGARAALRLAFEWPGERHALGFGVWPLFADTRFDGPAAAPFFRWKDLQRINPTALWTAIDEPHLADGRR